MGLAHSRRRRPYLLSASTGLIQVIRLAGTTAVAIATPPSHSPPTNVEQPIRL